MDSDSIETGMEGVSSDTIEVIDHREPRLLLAFVWSLSLVPTITTLLFIDDDMTALIRRFLVEAAVLIVVAVWVERRSTANDWREHTTTKHERGRRLSKVRVPRVRDEKKLTRLLTARSP